MSRYLVSNPTEFVYNFLIEAIPGVLLLVRFGLVRFGLVRLGYCMNDFVATAT